MRISFTRAAMWILFLLAWPTSLLAQLGTAKASAIVQRDPSTTSPILERLDEGDRVVLVDLSPDSGFYHVRTEDDKVGWVLVNDITVSKAPEQTPPEEVAPMENAAPSAIAAKAPPTPAGTCDASLWKHVYHANRLIVKKQCIEVTGTMVDATAPLKSKQPDGVRHEPDGDTHGWLKVDPQFKNLLNAGNTSAEGGNLVFEIVCRFPVTQADAQTACQGYKDKIQLPKVGSHVRIVGTYVQDTFHAKWNEIHPVTSITVIP